MWHFPFGSARIKQTQNVQNIKSSFHDNCLSMKATLKIQTHWLLLQILFCSRIFLFSLPRILSLFLDINMPLYSPSLSSSLACSFRFVSMPENQRSNVNGAFYFFFPVEQNSIRTFVNYMFALGWLKVFFFITLVWNWFAFKSQGKSNPNEAALNVAENLNRNQFTKWCESCDSNTWMKYWKKRQKKTCFIRTVPEKSWPNFASAVKMEEIELKISIDSTINEKFWKIHKALNSHVHIFSRIPRRNSRFANYRFFSVLDVSVLFFLHTLWYNFSHSSSLKYRL